MPSSLAELVCGAPNDDTELASLLNHQAAVIDYLYQLGRSVRNRPETDLAVSLIGPTVGRSLLEVCTSTLLARLDSFRLLTLRATQLADQALEKRNELSIQWTGDIQPKDKRPEVMWSLDRSPEKLTRALLGHYYDEVFWKPSLRRAVDRLSDGLGSSLLSGIRLYEPDKFIPTVRSRMGSLYSSCSKGLHHEFVIPVANFYDSTTVRTFMLDARELTSTLAVVANLGSAVLYPLPFERVLELVAVLEKEEI